MIVAPDEEARGCRARRCGRIRGALTAALMLLVSPRTDAAGGRATALPCTPDGGEAVRIDHVDPDFNLVLVDGRTVVLAGIDPARATAARPTLAADAQVKLDGWLRGRDAMLRALSATADRWNRLPALVFATAGAPDEAGEATPARLSVAFALVDAGLARGRPDAETHACWAALVSAEAAARAARLGLWADPAYAVRDAADGAAAQAAAGGLALIEGSVTRIGHGRARLYVGFGQRGADVELHLGKRSWPVLAEAGLDKSALVGRRLRVRGYLDDRFGPSIDVSSPDQIEVLSGTAPDSPASDP